MPEIQDLDFQCCSDPDVISDSGENICLNCGVVHGQVFEHTNSNMIAVNRTKVQLSSNARKIMRKIERYDKFEYSNEARTIKNIYSALFTVFSDYEELNVTDIVKRQVFNLCSRYWRKYGFQPSVIYNVIAALVLVMKNNKQDHPLMFYIEMVRHYTRQRSASKFVDTVNRMKSMFDVIDENERERWLRNGLEKLQESFRELPEFFKALEEKAWNFLEKFTSAEKEKGCYACKPQIIAAGVIYYAAREVSRQFGVKCFKKKMLADLVSVNPDSIGRIREYLY